MGLRQTISEWVKIIKDALDLGPEFPAAMEARRAMFAEESARLQHLLEQTRKASQEKDELIARLRAAGAVTGNMVADGAAYYIRRANALDGPFCTSCFQRNHEIVRIAPAPTPKDADETSTDWVQCAKCKTPFRSDRISQYLNPGRGTGSDDKRQKAEDGKRKTEDRVQKTEPPSSPPSVLYHPPASPEPEPKPPQAQDSTLWSPSPNAAPSVEDPKPAAAQTAVLPEESDAPKPVKTARKPRRTPKRDAPPLEEAPSGETQPAEKDSQAPQVAVGSPSQTRPRARKPRNSRPERTKTADRSKPAQ